jgi:hypothetical protein
MHSIEPRRSTMAASEAAVTAAQSVMKCKHLAVDGADMAAPYAWCGRHGGTWTDRGCPVAVAAADAAVDADRASIQAETLRDYANELDWVRPEKCPCANPESCCGSEQSCDAMQPVTHIVGAINLRARADRIEGKP